MIHKKGKSRQQTVPEDQEKQQIAQHQVWHAADSPLLKVFQFPESSESRQPVGEQKKRHDYSGKPVAGMQRGGKPGARGSSITRPEKGSEESTEGPIVSGVTAARGFRTLPALECADPGPAKDSPDNKKRRKRKNFERVVVFWFCKSQRG